MPVPRPLPLSAALATLFAAAIALPAHGQSLIELYDAARGFDEVANIAGGIDAWSAQQDPSVPRY